MPVSTRASSAADMPADGEQPAFPTIADLVDDTPLLEPPSPATSEGISAAPVVVVAPAPDLVSVLQDRIEQLTDNVTNLSAMMQQLLATAAFPALPPTTNAPIVTLVSDTATPAVVPVAPPVAPAPLPTPAEPLPAVDSLAGTQRLSTNVAPSVAPAIPDAGHLKPSKPKPYTGARGADKVDVATWLFAIETYFDAAGLTNEERRVKLAVSYLEGNALVWWRSRCIAHGVSCTYAEFTADLTAAFQPVDPERQARDRIARLRQVGSVGNYAAEFNIQMFHLPHMHMADRVHLFCEGLKPNVHHEVLHKQPATLKEAIEMAEREDAFAYQMSKKEPKFAPSPRQERANMVDYREVTCWNCGKKGHKLTSCPEDRDQTKVKAARELFQSQGFGTRR